MLLGGGLSLGNLTIEVSRASGFYPDIVMGGAAPLKQLRKASLVEAESRQPALVAAVGNGDTKHIDYRALGTEAGFCHHCHTGRCPVGITTQDSALEKRLVVEEGARKVRNYLTVLSLEEEAIAIAFRRHTCYGSN